MSITTAPTRRRKSSLPASTVIHINTLGIYDAPYPGGNLVTTPVAGSTLYVRANVSDPFGSYDITSLGLAVTAPSPGANFTNTLTGANVVANDGCSKTYEFAWATGPTTGSYNIAATAHEGTEGVTATAGASVTLIFLDLGTPSTTEFTSGNNGPATNSYPASRLGLRPRDGFEPQHQRRHDGHRHSSPSPAAPAIRKSLTLIETGTNTGIFTACHQHQHQRRAARPTTARLYAPVGSILTASYTDPTDPS